MPMRIGDGLPSFEGATSWIGGSQSEVEKNISGQPTLVHFWAVSCGICKEKMPELNEIKAKYTPFGLKVVSIHMPRQEADTEVEKISEAIDANRLTEPVAIDNLHRLKDAFLNEQAWVPVYYLFDAEGKMRSRAAGEFGVGVLRTALEKMFSAEAVSA